MPAGGGMSTVGVGINFSATDMASGPIGLIGRNFGNLQQQITSGSPRIVAGFTAITAGATAMAAGMGTVRQAWDFAETASGFERSMAAVRSVSMASSAEFERLSEAAIQAGIATRFSPEEAAGGLRMLAQQGLNTNNSIAALVPTLNFATAGQIEVAEAAEIGMGVLNAYGMEVTQLPMVYDRLMRSTQMSALSTNEFLTVMGRAASSGNLFGQQLDQVLVTLASVRSQGIPATVATTAVGEAFRRLGAEQETQRMLQRRGVRVFDEQTGRFRDFNTVMREYGQAISHLTEAEQTRLVAQAFGIRGMRTYNAIANLQARVTEGNTERTLTGAAAQRHYMEMLENSGGTVAEFAARDLASMAGGLDLLRGTLETLGTSIGLTFIGIFNPMIRLVTGTLNRMILVWRSIPEGMRSIIGIVTLVVAGFSIFGGAITFVIGTVILLASMLGSLLGVLAAVAVGVAVAMVPIMAAFGGAIAIGYALYRAYEENLGGLRDFVTDIASQISLAWRGVTAIFSGGAVSGGLRGEMIAAGGALLPFMDALQNLWNNLVTVKDAAISGFQEVWAGLSPVIQELQVAFKELWSVVSDMFSTFLGGANALPEERFRSLGRTIGQFLGGAIRIGIQLITRMIGFVTHLIRVWRGVTSALEPVFAYFRWAFGNLATVLRRLWVVLGPIVRAMLALGEFMAGGGIIGHIFAANAQRGEEQRARVADRQERRRRESVGRTEEATMERPAAAARDGGADGGGGREIASAIRESNRRRTPIEMSVDVNLDGDQMQSVMRTAEVDGQSIDGGLPTSGWTDF